MTDSLPPDWTSWRERFDVEGYEQRWERLAAAGVDPHGEAALVQSYAPASVLDAGCGTGRVAIELAHRGVVVVGVDRDPDMIDLARAKAPELRWVVADLAEHLPFPSRRGNGSAEHRAERHADEPEEQRLLAAHLIEPVAGTIEAALCASAEAARALAHPLRRVASGLAGARDHVAHHAGRALGGRGPVRAGVTPGALAPFAQLAVALSGVALLAVPAAGMLPTVVA